MPIQTRSATSVDRLWPGLPGSQRVWWPSAIALAAIVGAGLLVPDLAWADGVAAPAVDLTATGAPDATSTVSSGGWLNRLQAVLGLCVMVAGAWWFREKRPDQVFPTRVVIGGLSMQLLLGVLILKTPIGEPVFAAVNDGFVALMAYSDAGAEFLFGDLIAKPGGGEHWWVKSGAFIGFSVLPTIIFFSSLMAVLYHLGIMIRIVRLFSRVIARALGTSGAETLSATGNIFVGQTEAPLLVRPFLEKMTRSELNTVMVGGFATVAGGVMAAYVGMLQSQFPDIAGHLLAASLMSAPAALVIGKLMVPETETPATGANAKIEIESIYANVIEAAATGASDGLKLAVNVGAMLLAFIALIALVNGLLSGLFGLVGLEGWTLQQILGVVMAPVAWLLGVDYSEAAQVGTLLGVKTVINEFVAYLDLAQNLGSPNPLSERSRIIVTYALCGFANFSSIGIQIGGISAIAPSRKRELSLLGLRAMIGGTLGAFMTAALAGLLV